MKLAPYATQASQHSGRRIAEPESATRSAFQRDRDRIIHSGAFRRLRNKTQVFVEFEGDFYRTRLTHSLEVAQIARSIARQLAVDEDLTEAVALAHDLGHTCFGHCGEDALNEAMQEFGGFNHNDQTFRIVTMLEHRNPRFDGLNLTWETLEAIVKHNGPLVGERRSKPVPPTIAAFNTECDLQLEQWCGIEGQIAALSDDIAYNTHDVDDGVRAGMLTFDDIAMLPLFDDAIAKAQAAFPEASQVMVMHEAVRQVIGFLVADLVKTTRDNLERIKPVNAAAVRACGEPVVTQSQPVQESLLKFRRFLMANFYRHPIVNRFNVKAARIVRELFSFYLSHPNCLPPEWWYEVEKNRLMSGKNACSRLIADYIAGMTDRYAITEYQRIFSMEKI